MIIVNHHFKHRFCQYHPRSFLSSIRIVPEEDKGKDKRRDRRNGSPGEGFGYMSFPAVQE